MFYCVKMRKKSILVLSLIQNVPNFFDYLKTSFLRFVENGEQFVILYKWP